MSVEGMQRTVSVTGVGRVATMPDLLVLSLAVETQAVTISEALAENNKQVAAVLSVLKDHGVQKLDIQTTHLSIDPVAPPQDPNDRHTPEIAEYRVRNGLSAKLRDMQRAGAVIDAAAQAAGDAIRIEGVSFSFAEPASLVSAARKRAIEDAKDRARQLTDGLGVDSKTSSRSLSRIPVVDRRSGNSAALNSRRLLLSYQVSPKSAFRSQLVTRFPRSKFKDLVHDLGRRGSQ